MQKRSSKSESTQKTEQDKSCWKFLTMAVLGWVLLGISCSVTLCLCFGSWMSRTMISESFRDCGHDDGDSLLTVTTRWRRGQRKTGLVEIFWLWPFLVGFCSGLAVLSLYAFALAVGWAEQWYPRVSRTIGVTAVTRFWQWLLDEGEGGKRTSEMSTGTRKSE